EMEGPSLKNRSGTADYLRFRSYVISHANSLRCIGPSSSRQRMVTSARSESTAIGPNTSIVGHAAHLVRHQYDSTLATQPSDTSAQAQASQNSAVVIRPQSIEQ